MYNGQFHYAHPPTHVVISILREIQVETTTKICSILKGINKNMALADLKRIKASIKIYDQYKINKNITMYLSKISSIYQGKNVF
jgi:hypothetical protein